MNKLFVLSLLVPVALGCSCQKRDTMTEQQLAQRKADLDARAKALDEREKALGDRQKLAAKPRVPTAPRTAPAEPQRSIPPELKGLIADPSHARDENEQRITKNEGCSGAATSAGNHSGRGSCFTGSIAHARVNLGALVRRFCRNPPASLPNAWQGRARTEAYRWN